MTGTGNPESLTPREACRARSAPMVPKMLENQDRGTRIRYGAAH